ncbi:hypothetical protein CASFOL_032804 [Castilleja foliolosa]|uniref:Uncharacterized protein n=1 Tax=Castilleja foliolosa TaxID=1961234 RepID=A0ABD3C3E9_9LAMI
MPETSEVVAGGGAVEAALSVYLENLATTLGFREQLAIAEFAESLLVIPKVRKTCPYHFNSQYHMLSFFALRIAISRKLGYFSIRKTESDDDSDENETESDDDSDENETAMVEEKIESLRQLLPDCFKASDPNIK